MGRKSNKLYAIQVIPLSVQRDKQLSEILNSTPLEVTIKRYIGGGSYGIYFSNNFTIIKKWKTYNGCKKYLQNIVLKNGPFSLDSHDDSSYDWTKVTYEICMINEEWNNHIDNEIDKETKKYELYIKKLLNLKLS